MFKCYLSATFGNMSLEEGVNILYKEIKDKPNESDLREREGQVEDEDEMMSDEIQPQREADVLDISAPIQAVMEAAPVPGSSDDEFLSSPESRPVKPRAQRKASFVI